MRSFFIILLLTIGAMAWLNLSFLPSRTQTAKEIIDRHIHTQAITDSDEITYDGHLNILKSEAWIDNLEIRASYGKWDRTEYHDIVLYADRISYDAHALFWQRQREVVSIKDLGFSGILSFDEVAKRLAESNVNIIDPITSFDDGHLYIRCYFSPLKSKLVFDGRLVITPSGGMRFHIDKIFDVDGMDITAKPTKDMIEELSNLLIPIRIMDQQIPLGLIEMTDSGIRIAGGTYMHLDM